MSQTVLRGLFAASLLLLLGVVAASVISKQAASEGERPPAVFMCRESSEIFYGASQVSPAVHPVTDRATLLQAVYCPQCEVWQPAPPADRLYKNPQGLLCPKCQTPRTFTGELPADATEL